MTASLLVAVRYIRPRRLSFIAIIGIVSVLGIVIGTAALICVLSLFNGFRGLAETLMTDFGPHVRVYLGSGMDANSINSGSVPGATNVSPVVLSKVALQSGSHTGAAFGIGMNPTDTAAWRSVMRSVIVGEGVGVNSASVPGAIVALGLADQLHIYVGDTLSVLAPSQIERAITTGVVPTGYNVEVRGLFRSNSSRDADETFIYVPDATMRAITERSVPTAFDIRLANAYEAESVANALRARFPGAQRVETWIDLNRGMYDTMRLERIGSFIVLTLILLVAVFNIVVSLTLGVVEKRRDIAVMKSIGFTDTDVRNVFLYQGLIIGLVSVFLGVFIGVGLCVGQQNFHWIAFDVTQGYLVPALPVMISASDVALVAGVGLLLAGSAAIYPALRAASANPADGLRSE